VESQARRLRQERAILTARQGDAQLPASGTLLAHRNRLKAELQRADDERTLARQHTLDAGGMVFLARPTAAIQRDIRRVEDELDVVKRKIMMIDAIIAREEAGHTAISK
jgi:hypothetical protein